MLHLFPVFFVSLPSAMSVGEGDGTVEVCATLLRGAVVAIERDFMITLATANDYYNYRYYYYGYATAGSDYNDTSMILTFSPGSSDGDTECMIVTIIDDDALEADQTFFVTLTTSDDDVRVSVDTMTVTITDNDELIRCCIEY